MKKALVLLLLSILAFSCSMGTLEQGEVENDNTASEEPVSQSLIDVESAELAGYQMSIVNFPDRNLEAAIRERINRPTGPIYAYQLASMTTLIAQAKGIVDLRGLEACTNLTTLVLLRNNIVDISPIAGLTKLRTLNLMYNRIRSVEALRNLTNLSSLLLIKNEIKNIEPLGKLDKLYALRITYNGMEIHRYSRQGMINLDVVNYHIANGCDVSWRAANIVR